MRMPIWNKPRIICCAEYRGDYLCLPRGCVEAFSLDAYHKNKYITGMLAECEPAEKSMLRTAIVQALHDGDEGYFDNAVQYLSKALSTAQTENLGGRPLSEKTQGSHCHQVH
jgi:hypothetical protein